jgi:hypothetical protein
MKKTYLIYSLFINLLLEYFSMIINNCSNYDIFWYPLLQNIGYINLLLILYLHSNRLGFCQFKKLGILLLAFYFSFNLVALLCQINYYFYIQIAQYILFFGINILFLYSLKKPL